jgi:hypothetical protein
MARRGGEVEKIVDMGEGINIKVMEKWMEEQKVWAAGEVLGRYVLADGVLASSSVCVELGAGTGVVSLAIAAKRRDQPCAGDVIATDASRESLRNIKRNAALNKASARLKVSEYQWGSSLPPDWSSRADVILGSDVVYSPHVHYSASFFKLAKTIAELLSPVCISPKQRGSAANPVNSTRCENLRRCPKAVRNTLPWAAQAGVRFCAFRFEACCTKTRPSLRLPRISGGAVWRCVAHPSGEGCRRAKTAHASPAERHGLPLSCQVSIVPIPAAAIADVPSEVAPAPSPCPLHFCPREFARALRSRAFPSERAFFKRLHCRSLRGFS